MVAGPALLLELEVLSGGRRLLVLGDGAAWIRTWFASLGIDPKARIVCWWHLRKRCSENRLAPRGPQGPPSRVRKALLDRLWEGKVTRRSYCCEERGVGEEPEALEDLIGSLEKRPASIPDSGNGTVGLWIASTVWRSSTTGRCRGIASTRG